MSLRLATARKISGVIPAEAGIQPWTRTGNPKFCI